MKKILLAGALLGATSTFAFAADLPSRRAPPVYVPPVIAPAFTWTGLYAGLNAGYAFSSGSTLTYAAVDPALAVNVGGTRPGFISNRSSGFTGGGQIGYNYQLGNFAGLGGFFGGGGIVAGVEADAAYTSLNRGTIYQTAVTSTAVSRTDYVGTVRGRLGYAFDNFLVYGTGGFAYGGVRDTSFFYNAAGAPIYGGARNTIKTGYAYGGGLEYAIPTSSFLNFFKSSAVTLKAEYIRYDLGTTTIGLPNFAGADLGYAARIRSTGNLARAGINYKFDFFGTPAAPVVARY